MALFTDSNIVTLDDLLPFEGGIVQVSSTHGINVDTKISLAVSAIGDKLLLWLLNAGQSDPQAEQRRQIGLSTVVVTSTLRRWLCLESLSAFFAEAYNVQLNTRFQGKWIEYQKAASEASEMVRRAGIGIVNDPLPKPALPLVAIGAGGAPAGSLFIQTAWVNVEGGEGALSPVNGVLLPANSSITVTMAEGGNAPEAALGWNVYASSGQSKPTRQNSSALTIGSSWVLPASGLIAGAHPIDGQVPDVYIPISRQIQRG